jgi:hypothetical protein
MVNYNNSMIYKLVCNDINIKDFYIGSTVNFRRRKTEHKGVCNNSNTSHYNYKVYQCIRNNGGWDNWNMVLVEKTPCADRLELRKIEREFMEKLGSSLNSISAYKSKAEYYEYHKESNKEYYKFNKNKILEYKNIRIICDICNTETTKNNIKRHKATNKCMSNII